MKHIIASIILGGLLTATSARAASTAPSYAASEWSFGVPVSGSPTICQRVHSALKGSLSATNFSSSRSISAFWPDAAT